MHLYFECVCMFVFTCKCSSVTKGVCVRWIGTQKTDTGRGRVSPLERGGYLLL